MQWLARALVRGASLWRVFARVSARRAFSLTLAASVLCWALGPTAGSADTPEPLDLNSQVREQALVPAPPAGFLEESVGKVRLRFHPQDEGVARRLAARLPVALRKVTEELGIDEDQALELRIARGPREMAALAPRRSPPPAYAVGVAYPALGLIILSVVDPGSWLPPNLDQVLTHELSHIALYRAAGERPLPLWFIEGLAVHQAGEHRLQRVQTLWEAAIVDDVLPTSGLSNRFPSRPNQVNLAYAQSADLVEHLLRSQIDQSRLIELLRQVKAGNSFEQSLLSAYHVDLPYLEREWKRSLSERYRVLPMVLTGTALWGGIAVLVVIAFWRRRKDQREKLLRWAEEEALEDSARAAVLATPTLSTAPTTPEPQLFMVAAHARDSAVPTIEHEGQRHTLH